MVGLQSPFYSFFSFWRLINTTEKDGKSEWLLFGFYDTWKRNFNGYSHVLGVDLFNDNNIYVARCRRYSGNGYGGRKPENHLGRHSNQIAELGAHFRIFEHLILSEVQL